MILTILMLIALALGLGGSLGDAYTTYEGIFVKKVAKEGDMSWLAQWAAKAPWRLFVVKPAMIGAVALVTNLWPVLPYTLYAQIVAYLLFAGFGLFATLNNVKVNDGQ